MKAKRILAVAILLALTLTCCLVACKKELTDKSLEGDKIADFTTGEAPDTIFESDGWANGGSFNVVWAKENVEYGEDAMHLSITEEERTAYVNDEEKTFPYTAGEARTKMHYGYGDFEVSMKPAKKVGTASTFFICTGPYDTGLDGKPQKHDEIDIEFLGKDTTRVQFNYFVNGKGGHEHMYDLGFDASKEYHTYGFRWTKDYIVWFVDGKPVYKVEASAKNPMPSAPGRILANYWCGTAYNWMGKYDGPNGETADYQWIKTSATSVDLTPSNPDVPPTGGDSSDVPTEGWTNIDYSGFDGWGEYTVDKTNGLTISHASAKDGWKCAGMKLSSSYSWVKFNVKNNDTGTASVRIDVKQESPSVGGVAGVYCEVEGVASCDATESVAMITLDGGQNVDVVLKMKDINIDQFVIFLNSMQNSGGAATGSVTITDLQGIVNETPGGNNPGGGDVPSGESVELTFTSEQYTPNPKGSPTKQLTVVYDGIVGNSYSNIQADISLLATGKNTLSITITNNVEQSVKLRFDIQGTTWVKKGEAADAGTDACNVSARANGHSEVYTDATYGGSYITVGSGEEVTIVITFDSTMAQGAAKKLLIYIDSSDWQDSLTHNGNVTFSNFIFSNN